MNTAINSIQYSIKNYHNKNELDFRLLLLASSKIRIYFEQGSVVRNYYRAIVLYFFMTVNSLSVYRK